MQNFCGCQIYIKIKASSANLRADALRAAVPHPAGMGSAHTSSQTFVYDPKGVPAAWLAISPMLWPLAMQGESLTLMWASPPYKFGLGSVYESHGCWLLHIVGYDAQLREGGKS